MDLLPIMRYTKYSKSNLGLWKRKVLEMCFSPHEKGDGRCDIFQLLRWQKSGMYLSGV